MLCETRCNLAVEAARHDLYCVGLVDAYHGIAGCGDSVLGTPAAQRGVDCVDMVHWRDDEYAAALTPAGDDDACGFGGTPPVANAEETQGSWPAAESEAVTYQSQQGVPLIIGAAGADVAGGALLDVMA